MGGFVRAHTTAVSLVQSRIDRASPNGAEFLRIEVRMRTVGWREGLRAGASYTPPVRAVRTVRTSDSFRRAREQSASPPL